MQKIAIEMERLRNPYTGLGQYCLQLGQGLAAQPASGQSFEGYVPPDKLEVFGGRLRCRPVRNLHRWTGVPTDATLWHGTHQDAAYWPSGHQTALVMTVHDLNFLERTDYAAWKKRWKLKALQRKINRCQGLVYISQFVRDWVHRHLQVPATTLEQVIYNGNNLSADTVAQARPDWQKAKPFLFSIGIHPKKNYRAMLSILQAHPALEWWLAGADARGGCLADLEATAAQMGIASEHLVFVGPVSEEEEKWLFQNCLALLFPSLSEGFGLPVVEAMSCGKPVFLSERTSLPEVGGTEAYYFPDFSPEQVQATFAQGMRDFEQDPGKPQRLKNRAAEFDWNVAAKAYIQLYQRVLSNVKPENLKN